MGSTRRSPPSAARTGRGWPRATTPRISGTPGSASSTRGNQTRTLQPTPTRKGSETWPGCAEQPELGQRSSADGPLHPLPRDTFDSWHAARELTKPARQARRAAFPPHLHVARPPAPRTSWSPGQGDQLSRAHGASGQWKPPISTLVKMFVSPFGRPGLLLPSVLFFLMICVPPTSTLFPSTTLFR